mgnify:CR=1 FL=1
MGHQSYAIAYDTAKQLAEIIRIIEMHNSWSTGATNQWVRYNENEEYKQLEVGEELTNLAIVPFRMNRQYRSPQDGPALSRVLLCDNGGGRHCTFEFLRWHLMRALPDVYVDAFHAVAPYPYDAAMERRLVMKRGTTLHLDDPVVTPVQVLPAEYWTRHIEGNGAFRLLMMGVDKPERKKRMREEPDVPPYLSTYTKVVDGLVVEDTRYSNAQRDEAEAHAKRLCSAAAALPGLIEQDRRLNEQRNRSRFDTKRLECKDYWRVKNGGRFWLTPEEVEERRDNGETLTKAMIKWQVPDKAYSEALKEAPAEEIERMIDAGKPIVLFEV